MKKIIFLIFLASIIFGQETKISNVNGSYVFVTDSKLSVKKLPTQLTANELLGDVFLRGTDNNEIRFTEKIEIKKRSKNDAKELWEKVHTELKSDDNGYKLSNDLKHKRYFRNGLKSIKYILDVPKEISIALSSVGGDFNINNISGEIELVTTGGDVILKELNGKIFTKTMGGDINSFALEGNIDLYSAGGDIECKNIIGNTKMKTMGGDIILEVIKGRIEAKTFGGDIEINEFDGKTIDLKTFGGDIKAINIKGDLNANTKGGDIEINDIKGNVEAETAGGDVEGIKIIGNAVVKTAGGEIIINDISGSIESETMSGDIEISKSYTNPKKDNSITLKSRNGSILLNIPQSMDGVINATAEGYGLDIVSDFDINISKINSRKIVAKGKINSGTHKIELNAVNGEIIIKKSNK